MSDKIITLTTDLSHSGYYLPAVKGFLYKEAPSAILVDIDHQVEAFNIARAAHTVAACYYEFPKGSIHIISVVSTNDNNTDYLLAEKDGHFFLLRDNGLIYLILNGLPDSSSKIKATTKSQKVFPLRYLLAEAAVKLIRGEKPEKIGEPLDQPNILTHPEPVIQGDMIRGIIFFVDSYGNAITNIRHEHFDRFNGKQDYKIQYARNDYIETISPHYETVEPGELICIFNSSGFMEIAINRGNAAALLGLETGRTILVEFS